MPVHLHLSIHMECCFISDAHLELDTRAGRQIVQCLLVHMKTVQLEWITGFFRAATLQWNRWVDRFSVANERGNLRDDVLRRVLSLSKSFGQHAHIMVRLFKVQIPNERRSKRVANVHGIAAHLEIVRGHQSQSTAHRMTRHCDTFRLAQNIHDLVSHAQVSILKPLVDHATVRIHRLIAEEAVLYKLDFTKGKKRERVS